MLSRDGARLSLQFLKGDSCGALAHVAAYGRNSLWAYIEEIILTLRTDCTVTTLPVGVGLTISESVIVGRAAMMTLGDFYFTVKAIRSNLQIYNRVQRVLSDKCFGPSKAKCASCGHRIWRLLVCPGLTAVPASCSLY